MLPFAGHAQQQPMPVMGYIDGANADARVTIVAALRLMAKEVHRAARQAAPKARQVE